MISDTVAGQPYFLPLRPVSGPNACDSGLWHQAQRRGQPFRKTTVRTPGPSCRAPRCRSKTVPAMSFIEGAGEDLELDVAGELDEADAEAADAHDEVAPVLRLLHRR